MYMAYTSDRLNFIESIYPISIGNQITLLSTPIVQFNYFAIFSSFRLTAWITILLTFIFSVIINSLKLMKNEVKRCKFVEIAVAIIIDHFLIIIGKRME